MSTVSIPSTLFEEIANLFASVPSAQTILDFRPSQASTDRVRELLHLNQDNELDSASRAELDQYEQAELLMRLVKARIRINQKQELPPR